LPEDHFNLLQTCNSARAGELMTAHGTVPTPVFLPVGSQATVKTLTPEEVRSLGFSMVLANNYHLYLRPATRYLVWRRSAVLVTMALPFALILTEVSIS